MAFDLSIIQNNIIGQFILPFVLFFAVAYGSLRTAKVFEDKQINAIIAAVIGLMASFYEPLVSALFQYMPFLFVILVILFSYNLISTLLGSKKEAPAGQTKEGTTDVIILIGAILLIVGALGRELLPDLGVIDQTNLIFLIALLGVFVVFKKGWKK